MPPFHANPHMHLVMLCIVTSPVEFGEEQFELQLPVTALTLGGVSGSAINDAQVQQQPWARLQAWVCHLRAKWNIAGG